VEAGAAGSTSSEQSRYMDVPINDGCVLAHYSSNAVSADPRSSPVGDGSSADHPNYVARILRPAIYLAMLALAPPSASLLDRDNA
jgi:hypothetical protein